MNARAWGYVLTVYGVGLTLAFSSFAGQPVQMSWTFVAFLLLATAAQLMKVEAPTHQLYYMTRIFQFASLLLLPPPLYVITVAVSHTIEWVKERLRGSNYLRVWYIQPFNIATHIIAGLTVQLWLQQTTGWPILLGSMSTVTVVAITSGAILYVVLNHIIVATALILARGVSLRESGVLDVENLSTDLVLLLMGYVAAVLWTINHWLMLIGVLPLFLIYRALMIPRLKEEAHLDSKTRLMNSHYFMRRLEEKFQWSEQAGRPLTVLMADLDLLRNINNTYGHLAGDEVLAGIGRLIRQVIRTEDIAGRFGGEEFAIALPHLSWMEAKGIAERLRQAVEAEEFKVGTSSTPIKVTISIGVASYPADGDTIKQIIHQADVAVYQAKIQGRNCVVCNKEVPHSFTLGVAAQEAAERPVREAYTFVPRPVVRDREEVAPHATAPALLAQSLPPEPLQAGAESSPPPSVAAEELPHLSETTEAVPTPAPQMPMLAQVAISSLFCAALLLVAATYFGFPSLTGHSITAVLIFALLALASEVFQIDLYGDSSVSVSMAFLFGAGLFGGIPGVALVSTVISLSHYVQRRPDLRKTVASWSVHVFAGLAPWLLTMVLDVPFTLSTMPLLVLPTALAALIYFGIEMGLFSVVIGLAQQRSPIEVWKQQFQWLAPQWVVLGLFGLFLGVGYESQGVMGMFILVLPLAVLRSAQRQYLNATTNSILELRRLNEELSHANQEIVAASESIHQLNDELFLILAKIIDARDPFVSGHAAKVAEYATAIATQMGFDAARVEQVRQAGFLHDVGKLGIPDSILHKPSSLTEEEYEYIKIHATLGGNLIETSHALKHLAPFVCHHHERWDGRGYPARLKGEEIPVEARILALCDTVEAMVSDRPYQRSRTLDEVIAEIKRCSGTQFDPAVVQAFLEVMQAQNETFLVNSAQEVMQKMSVERHALQEQNRHTSQWTNGYLSVATPKQV